MKMSKATLTILFTLILLSAILLPFVGNVSAQDASIIIHADGTVEGTSLITRNGNLYTLTGDINGCLTLQKDNAILDGKGFTLTGSGAITLTEVNNVTIRNLLLISNEGTGIMINRVSGANLLNLSIKAERAGIRARNLTDSIIADSYVEAKVEYAIALSFSPNNQITNNTIVSTMIDALNCGYSSNVLILGNNLTYNPSQFPIASGIQCDGSTNLTIKENTITRFPISGINLQGHSDSNRIEANIIMYCGGGIRIAGNDNNLLENHVESNTGPGISLETASRSILRGNRLSNNSQNLQVGSYSTAGWVNDIDASNWVENKVVYYWVNEVDKTVPLDAGYVALINCTRIMVHNQTFTNAGESLLLVFTNNSTIQGNSFSDNSTIHLYNSSNNNIFANTFTNNDKGLNIDSSSLNNKVSGNNFTSNNYAITLSSSSNNTLTHNNFINNENAVYLIRASDNTIYLNNFQNNTRQVGDTGMSSPYASVSPAKTTAAQVSVSMMSLKVSTLNFIGPSSLSVNNWDNGNLGNYWSTYDGADANGDGIGDLPFYLYGNNQDNYPLMTAVASEPTFSPPPTHLQSTPTPSPSPNTTPNSTATVPELPLQMVIGLLIAAMIVAAIYVKRRL